MRRLITAVLVLTTALVCADEVVLKSGRRVTGVVVERTPEMVFLEVGPGRVGFPMSQVERIETTPSPLDEYRRRAERLAAADSAAWLDLGYWARDRGLLTQARRAFEQVLSVEPESRAAHAALGDVPTKTGWASGDDIRRREAEADMAARDREEQQERRERAERAAAAAAAERAVAEARAREAEARAREAEAAARADGGIPVTPYGAPTFGQPVCPPLCQPVAPADDVQPSPAPPPRHQPPSHPPTHQPPVHPHAEAPPPSPSPAPPRLPWNPNPHRDSSGR